MSTSDSTTEVRITPLNDHAALLTFGNRIDPDISNRVIGLYQELKSKSFNGFIEAVPAYASLAVFYNVQQVRSGTNLSAFEVVKKILQELIRQKPHIVEGRGDTIEIPVCYDDEFSPDASEVCRRHGLTHSELIALHTSPIYRVYMNGFVPGFAYMGVVDNKLVTPRKQQPRGMVPAGSVGVAGWQTGIYPIDAPGGWQIIGKTPLVLFDLNKSIPCLLGPGDKVKFVAIDKKTFQHSYGS